MKRILVTGASGFVGRYLCDELLRRGWQVRAVLRTHLDGLPPAIEQVIVAGVDGQTDWGDALQDVDVVIHLAARVHVMHDTAADPLDEFRKVNTAGTARLAQFAASSGVKRMVYVSSIKVNGEETAGECRYTEQDAPAPQSPYGISKYEAEQALGRIAQRTGLEVAIVRPTLVYGPEVKGNSISLLRAIDRGIPLPLAAANNARSLVYVGNLVDALIVCASHSAAAGKTYLISDGEPVSTAELIRRIAHALGCNSRLFYFPISLLRFAATLMGKGAQVTRLTGSLMVDDDSLRRELGWNPPFTLEQGLNVTARWYRQQHPR